MKRLMLCAVLLALFGSNGARATDACYWYRATAGAGGWFVLHGQCVITMTGDKFTALLYDDDHAKFLRVKMSGAIQDAKARASVETEGTDAGIETFQGALSKQGLFGNLMSLQLGDGLDTIGITFGGV